MGCVWGMWGVGGGEEAAEGVGLRLEVRSTAPTIMSGSSSSSITTALFVELPPEYPEEAAGTAEGMTGFCGLIFSSHFRLLVSAAPPPPPPPPLGSVDEDEDEDDDDDEEEEEGGGGGW